MRDYKILKQSSYYNDILKNSMMALDLFGQPIQISMKQQGVFKTPVGLVVSLGIIMLCACVFWQDFSSVIYYDNPNVFSSETLGLLSDPVNLSFENYTMAILMLNGVKTFGGFDNVFNLSVSACSKFRVDTQGNKQNFTHDCIPLNIEPCKIGTQFVTDQQKLYFKNFDLANVYCLSPNQSNEVQLQGNPGLDRYQYIQINIAQCNNITSNYTCASPEYINSKLRLGTYAVYMMDNLIDMNQMGEPYQMITKLFHTTFSSSISKQIQSTYIQSYTDTDDGYVTSNSNITSKLIYNGDTQDQQPAVSDYFIRHLIMLDNDKVTYHRSYQKLQSIFGKLGGLFSVLFYIMLTFMAPLVKKLMYLQMINKIFTFDQPVIDDIQSSKVNQKLDNSLIEPRAHHYNGKVSKRFSQPSRIIKPLTSVNGLSTISDIANQQEIKTFLKQKNSSLNIGLRSVISLVFCCTHRKVKAQIDYGAQKVTQKLDIFYIIKKLLDVEKLKTLLLNDEQQKLFNCLPKPCIPNDLHLISEKSQSQDVIRSYEKRPQFKSVLLGEETELKRVTNAYDAYKKIIESPQKSSLDSKLLLFLDKDIKQLFSQLMEKEEFKLYESKQVRFDLEEQMNYLNQNEGYFQVSSQRSDLQQHDSFLVEHQRLYLDHTNVFNKTHLQSFKHDRKVSTLDEANDVISQIQIVETLNDLVEESSKNIKEMYPLSLNIINMKVKSIRADSFPENESYQND